MMEENNEVLGDINKLYLLKITFKCYFVLQSGLDHLKAIKLGYKSFKNSFRNVSVAD